MSKTKAKGFGSNESINQLKDTKNFQSNELIVNFLIYTLEKLLGLEFGTTHEYPLHINFSFFFNQPQNQDFLGHIDFDEQSFAKYTEYSKRISSNIEKNIENQTFFSFLGKKSNYKSVANNLKNRFKKDLFFYKQVFNTTTVQNKVKNFHSVYADVIWFFDMTKLEMFEHFMYGAPYLLLFIDCSAKYIVHWYLFEKEGNKISSKQIIQQIDKAIDTNASRPLILHSDSDYKNRSRELFLALAERNIIPSINLNIYIWTS